MKKIFFIIGFILFTIYSFADYREDVTTPKGTNIIAYVTTESSPSTRAFFDASYASSYPNAIQIATFDGYSSSRQFNCHGYAWYMSEQSSSLSSPRWIGYSAGNTDEHPYWTDGSFIEVSAETYPGKVSWASGDHSAITTDQPGWFISKWNEYPLMKHRWNDSPFGSTNLKYYVDNVTTTAIQGVNAFCTSQDYNLNYLPTGYTVNWTTISSYVAVSLSTPNSASTNVSLTGGTTPGSKVILKATITSPNNNTYTKQRTIQVGALNPWDYTIKFLRPGSSTHCGNGSFIVDGVPSTDYNALEIVSNSSSLTVTQLSGSPMFMVSGVSGNPYSNAVKVRFRNSCGWGNWGIYYVQPC